MNTRQEIRRGLAAAMLVLVGSALGQTGPAVYTTTATGGDWDAITWTSVPSLPGTIPGNHPMDVVSMPAFAAGSEIVVDSGSFKLPYGESVEFLTAPGGITGKPTAPAEYFVTVTPTTLSLNRKHLAGVIIVR